MKKLFLFGMIIIVVGLFLSGCNNKAQVKERAFQKFYTQEIPDIEENWETVLVWVKEILKEQKEQSKRDERFNEKSWKAINPNYSQGESSNAINGVFKKPHQKSFSSETKEEPKNNLEIWEEMLESPDKFIIKTTKDNKIFLEAKTGVFNENFHKVIKEEPFYYSAMVTLWFARDIKKTETGWPTENRFLKIFYIYTPDRSWEPVTCELVGRCILLLRTINKNFL